MMSSRDKILNTVKNNQPPLSELPALPGDPAFASGDPAAGPATVGVPDLFRAFISMLESIGGSAYLVSGFDRIATILHEQHPEARRIISGCPELASFAEVGGHYDDPHTLENVDLAILRAHFGVAENGACWITEDRMIERVLPFITQHLVLVLRHTEIVADMHQAYARIAAMEVAAASTGRTAAAGSYGFATFIAGPSKTADIEQSLVLGAHGPRSLTVFLLDEEISDAGFY
jgi:L-lactate dehydrogenase complex protein LldG